MPRGNHQLRPAIFLDRDGVLNPLVWREPGFFDSPYCEEEFRLFPWVGEALQIIKELGYLAVVTSNQPGVAKGYCTPQFLEGLNQKIQSHLKPFGVQLDGVYYCYHHPEGVVAPYRTTCDCRKPAPGMLRQAARELGVDLSRSFMVGDSLKDIAAGQAAGCRTIFLGWQEHHPEALRQGLSPEPDFIAANLWEAARHIQSAFGGGGSHGNLYR